LRQVAELLQAQGAKPFRVAAYRNAADTVEGFGGRLRTLFARQGRDGLVALPRIGVGIASGIAEMLETGRWAQLERSSSIERYGPWHSAVVAGRPSRRLTESDGRWTQPASAHARSSPGCRNRKTLLHWK
jgi:hypothetical protein